MAKSEKEFKIIGIMKCPMCGETLSVKEATNTSGTPWVRCPRCSFRSFFNGAEGCEIKKRLNAGEDYRTVGGMDFKSILKKEQIEEKKPANENRVKIGMFD